MRKHIFTPELFFYQRTDFTVQRIRNKNHCFFLPSTAGGSGVFFQPRKSIKEERIETDQPLSEKDEVKKAEQRTMEQQKKVEKQQPLKQKK